LLGRQIALAHALADHAHFSQQHNRSISALPLK
jgi:hypothetical protein